MCNSNLAPVCLPCVDLNLVLRMMLYVSFNGFVRRRPLDLNGQQVTTADQKVKSNGTDTKSGQDIRDLRTFTGYKNCEL